MKIVYGKIILLSNLTNYEITPGTTEAVRDIKRHNGEQVSPFYNLIKLRHKV